MHRQTDVPPTHIHINININIKIASMLTFTQATVFPRAIKKPHWPHTHTQTHTECTALMRAPMEIWDTRTRVCEGAGDCN